MNIKETDLVDIINSYLIKQKQDEIQLQTELKRQKVIQFVSCQFIDDYVSKNIASSDQGAFRRGLIDTLIADNFALWDKYNQPSTS